MNRYSDIKILKNINPNVGVLNAPYYNTTFYPEISLNESDIYVITTFGDRLDLLAFQFYNDSSLYWIIAAANPEVVDFGSLFITEGSQIRIPSNPLPILTNFKNLNSL